MMKKICFIILASLIFSVPAYAEQGRSAKGSFFAKKQNKSMNKYGPQKPVAHARKPAQQDTFKQQYSQAIDNKNGINKSLFLEAANKVKAHSTKIMQGASDTAKQKAEDINKNPVSLSSKVNSNKF